MDKALSTCWNHGATERYKYVFCIKNNDLPDNLTLYQDEILGVGTFGTVLKGLYQGQDAAIKLIALDTNIPSVDCITVENDIDCQQYTTKEFKREVEQAILTNKLDISPKILYHTIINLGSFKTPSNLTKKPLIALKKLVLLCLNLQV
jgi:hypothetical protein